MFGRPPDADKIRSEYEQEMVRLRAQYQAEQDSKAQLQEDLARLRTQFEGQMAQVQAQKEKSSANAANGYALPHRVEQGDRSTCTFLNYPRTCVSSEASSKTNAREKVLKR